MNKKRTAFLFLTLFLFSMLFSGTCSAGWLTKGGKTMYYVASTKTFVRGKWKKISGKWYYFDKNGYLKTGRFYVNGKYYYVTRSGGRQTDKMIGGYYYGADGAMARNCWKKINHKYFYFWGDGTQAVGQFTIGNKTYYCTKKDGRLTNKRYGDYYYNSAGVMVQNKWAGNYYYGEDGRCLYGKFTVDGKTYCCTEKDGKITSQWYNGNYYDADGVMATKTWIGYGTNAAYVNRYGTIIKGNKNPKNPPEDEDVRLLAAITYLEAGNQSYRGKVAVASVIVNRVESSRFPNTLKDVIYQSGQFTPAMNGSLNALYYGSGSIQNDCVKAAKEVLNEGSKLKGYYFFNIYGGSLKIDDHYFS